MEQTREANYFGEKISACRQNRNMTQEELAGRLGVTPQALSKWERGLSFPDIAMLADIARLLEVSTDYLLGFKLKGDAGNAGGQTEQIQTEIGNNLRKALTPLEIVIGEKYIPLFQGDSFVSKIVELRIKLAQEGILMPVVRIRDELKLEGCEFRILCYQEVLYAEQLEKVDGDSLDYMLQKLAEAVRRDYGKIMNPDLMKLLTDYLRTDYPALIDGIVPEKIHYTLLSDVVKKVISRGISIVFLPKMIEIMCGILWDNPHASIEAMAEQIVKELVANG
ncbi:MAG: helix-turn-helix domain-containing protein [Lachnospiraceae bacterium]|nr:helix-turn-helix domain-containing protein [Lachnospiraceae bacterium]